MCVCVCVCACVRACVRACACVCVREREREGESIRTFLSALWALTRRGVITSLLETETHRETQRESACVRVI